MKHLQSGSMMGDRCACIGGLLAIMVSAIAAGSARADEPLPATSMTPNMNEQRQAVYAFNRKISFDVYQARQQCHPSEFDAQALSLIDDWLKFDANIGRGLSQWQLQDQARELFYRHCDDPFIHFAHASMCRADDDSWEANDHYEQALANLGSAGYPAIWSARAALGWAQLQKRHGYQDQAAQNFALAADRLVQAIREGGFSADEPRMLTKELCDDMETFPSDTADRLCERLEGLLGIDRWMLKVVRARLRIQQAWEARGSGWAGEVEPAGWKGFEERLSEARALLLDAYAMEPSRPEAASMMITVAMAGSVPEEESERLWFDRAVAAQFDWIDAYQRYEYSIWPRWGGSYELMYQFGLECMQTRRYDTGVPYMLISVLSNIADEFATAVVEKGADPDDVNDIVWQRPGVYENAMEVLDAYVQEPGPGSNPRWCNSQAAAIAWRAGHIDDCRKYMERLEWNPDRAAGEQFDVWGRSLIIDASVSASPLRAQIEQAESLYRKGAYGEAVAAYEALLGRAADDEHVLRGIREGLMLSRLMRGFTGDEWTPLIFERNLPGWRPWRGAWRAMSDREVMAGPMRDGLYLICRAPFGRRFEIRGSITTSELKGSWANVGVLFDGSLGARYFSFKSMLIQSFKNTMSIGFEFGSGANGELVSLSGKAPKTYSFDMQHWDDQAVVSINDEKVFSGTVKENDEEKPGPLIALGGRYGATSGFAIYKNLEIRKLTERPKELDGPAPQAQPKKPASRPASRPSRPRRETSKP